VPTIHDEDFVHGAETSGAALRGVALSADFGVVVVDDDPRLRTRLAMQLGEASRVATYPSIPAMADKVGLPAVIVFGPSFAGSEGLGAISEYLRERPAAAGVLVVEELSTQLLQQAIRAGIGDVITIPQDPQQLIDAIQGAADHLNLAAVPTAPAGAGIGGTGEKGQVITVFSTKGGAGKSFVATNLAVMLARRSEAPVCIVDADLQFGDVAVMLKLVPQHTIADAVSSIQRMDAPLMKSLLVRHEMSGLYALPAPTEPAFADQIRAEDVIKIIDMVRTFCSYVVVDTPSYFTEVVIRLLEDCDDIVLVAGMDVPNIKNVKLGLNTLRLLNLPTSKVKLVLNRANSKVKIDVSEVERALGLKADTLVPSDISVPQSINKGVPVVIDNPKSGVARSMESLSGLFISSAPSKGRR
jgi:pilus assembly protein CpaE